MIILFISLDIMRKIGQTNLRGLHAKHESATKHAVVLYMMLVISELLFSSRPRIERSSYQSVQALCSNSAVLDYHLEFFLNSFWSASATSALFSSYPRHFSAQLHARAKSKRFLAL